MTGNSELLYGNTPKILLRNIGFCLSSWLLSEITDKNLLLKTPQLLVLDIENSFWN